MTQEIEVAARSLAECEAVIERGLSTFVEVGQALLEIRDTRTYRETHLTFQDYCRERWGWGMRRAQQMMEAARVVGVLEGGEANNCAPPKNEAQARELARLPEPEAVRQVWAEVKEEHGDNTTAAHVRAAADRRLGVERPVSAVVAQPSPVPAPEPESFDPPTATYAHEAPAPSPLRWERESVEVAKEDGGSGEAGLALTGTSRTTVPVHDASPTASIPNTQAIRDARLRTEVLHALRFATQLAAYAPDRVAAVLAVNDADAIDRLLSRLASWGDRYRQARTAPLRVVGGQG